MPIRYWVCVLMLPALLAADKPQRDPRVVRVMTYNIHGGYGSDGKFDLNRVAKIIKDADVDVAAIQGVYMNYRQLGFQAEQIASLTGMEMEAGVPNNDWSAGYGQVILSKKRFQKAEVHRLTSETDKTFQLAITVQIVMAPPLPDLFVVGTQLDAKRDGDATRLAQAQEIQRLIQATPQQETRQAILLGDFNATPDSGVIKFLEQNWIDAAPDSGPTTPAIKPDRKIDYVMLPKKGHAWKVVSATAIDEPAASDHRPVVVELKWEGEPVRKPEGHLYAHENTPIAHLSFEPPRSIQFSKNGEVIMAVSRQKARAWDAKSYRPLSEAFECSERIESAELSFDGKHVLIVSEGTAQVLDVRTKMLVSPAITHAKDVPVQMSRFSPDGTRIVTVPGTIKKSWIQSLLGSSEPVRSEREVHVLDAQSGKKLLALDHGSQVTHAKFSPDGRRLVTMSYVAKNARLWDAQTGQPMSGPIEDYDGGGEDGVAFSGDGRLFAIGNGCGVEVYDAETTIRVMKVRVEFGQYETTDAVRLSPDGSRVGLETCFNGLRCWDVRSGEPVGVEVPEFFDKTANSDLTRVVSGFDYRVRVWDVDRGGWSWSIASQSKYGGQAAFSPDGRRVVLGSPDGLDVFSTQPALRRP